MWFSVFTKWPDSVLLHISPTSRISSSLWIPILLHNLLMELTPIRSASTYLNRVLLIFRAEYISIRDILGTIALLFLCLCVWVDLLNCRTTWLLHFSISYCPYLQASLQLSRIFKKLYLFKVDLRFSIGLEVTKDVADGADTSSVIRLTAFPGTSLLPAPLWESWIV